MTFKLRGSSALALTGFSRINSTLYAKSGSTYTALSYSTFYVKGTERTMYYSDGDEEVSVQGDMYTGALYKPGTEYSGGLYSGFQPASIATKNITALTV